MREYTIFYQKGGKKRKLVVSTTSDLLTEFSGATITIDNILQHKPKTMDMPDGFESIFSSFKK